MKVARIEIDGTTRVSIVDGELVQPLDARIDVTELLAVTPAERAELDGRTTDGAPRPPDVRLPAPVQSPALTLLSATAPSPAWYEQPLFYRPPGGDTSANMSWSFEEMIAFASRGAEVATDDVLAVRTCRGGRLLEHWAHGESLPPRQPGDLVTLVAEGIGAVTNRVVAGVEPLAVPKVRAGHEQCPRPWHAAGRP
jgi:hypothetical protein